MKIIRAIDWIINKASIVSGLAVLFMMGFTTLNVILRIFGHPIPGDMELTKEVEVVIIYFCIAYCVILDTHIKIDLFKKLHILDHINNFVAFGVGVFIAIQCFNTVGTHLRMHSTTLVLGIPTAPFVFISGLGFTLFSLAIISVEVKLIISDKEKRIAKKQGLKEPAKGPVEEIGEVS
jgi:TRAP-type C4-dicarboxylate transport system permease small subunit